MTFPPIVWLPSPNRNLRDARYPIQGVVNHRIVGTLFSADVAFGVVAGRPGRNASTHFGIGYVDDKLEIHQYVDLSDMAWGNGDVRDPTWVLYQPGVNPNLTTVSIEHEDGGAANKGVVTEDIWRASMALQKLVTSGDPAAIRASGIRLRYDHHAAELARVPKDSRGFIDHNQIAGPNKPYCFRRWLDDPGFVEGTPSRRDRLLAVLNGKDDMYDYLGGMTPIVNRRVTLGAGSTARSTPEFNPKDYDENKIFTHPNEVERLAIGWVEGTNITLANGVVFDERTRWVVTDRSGGRPDQQLIVYHERDVVKFTEAEKTTGYTDEQMTQAMSKAEEKGRADGNKVGRATMHNEHMAANAALKP